MFLKAWKSSNYVRKMKKTGILEARTDSSKLLEI